MWKNFYTKKTDLNYVIPILEDWKKLIFDEETIKIKEYFATKVVVYFDNLMIFHQKKGLHNNLMDALGLAEKEMNSAGALFPPVHFYLIKEEVTYSLLISQYRDSEKIKEFAKEIDFKENSAILGDLVEMEQLQFNSWSTLAFDFELVNFSKNWINYTPSLEDRSRLQAEHILYNMNFKKADISLLEKINFQENITKHPQYQELLEKVMRVMPKIESSLEQEWRTRIVNVKLEPVEVNTTTKKNKSGI